MALGSYIAVQCVGAGADTSHENKLTTSTIVKKVVINSYIMSDCCRLEPVPLPWVNRDAKRICHRQLFLVVEDARLLTLIYRAGVVVG